MPDDLPSILDAVDTFARRHLGPREADLPAMLETVGCSSLDELIAQTVPASIRLKGPLKLGPPRGEHELIESLRAIASENKVARSFIGMGYYGCIVPPVIQRNILENPGWYTQYTPYQAEISQGRLEALINFQTMVADLTALPVANASLLDEATAAAEAMTLCHHAAGDDSRRNAFFVASDCHPQTVAVVQTRGRSQGVEIVVGDVNDAISSKAHGPQSVGLERLCGILLQYPTTDGRIVDYSPLVEKAHAAGVPVVVATDLLALTLIKPPGEWGADVAIGSAQRFGVPMGFGGPHAAFMAVRDELKRLIPGRLVGVSKDAHGNPAYRLAIQTREQHIRREKATSNICTAQVLLAIMASMYAVYHGPEGLRDIAWRVHTLTNLLHRVLEKIGVAVGTDYFFDTLRVRPLKTSAVEVLEKGSRSNLNLRDYGDGSIGISLDETTSLEHLIAICGAFGDNESDPFAYECPECTTDLDYPIAVARSSSFLAHLVFNSHHSETEMLRYIFKLQSRDLSLAHSMIPLGSCTMKLNATSEMLPVTWPEFSRMHPFAPAEQTRGYAKLFDQLESWLAEITGLPAVSLQPNAGSQGEYAGLLAIRAYHESNAECGMRSADSTTIQAVATVDPRSKIQNPKPPPSRRDACLIPTSAHGTNPASAVVAGFTVVPVACDAKGNVDLADLRAKAAAHANRLGAIMITYPSTHGVFEESIREICDVVHQHGGLVYMDGANMNAQVGLCRPGDFGADVCHLNLHKTFCIPHGGGGPGMGPICAAKHLAPFLPTHPLGALHAYGDNAECEMRNSELLSPSSNPKSVGPVSSAPYGSPSILTIPWVYIALMGAEGLKRATEIAILNANYMAKRLEKQYPVLYVGTKGRVAHEFILDCRAFEKSAGIKVEDIAKRLMDFGFHAPTMSFPVPGTLMIEPTESEPKAELDRFCDAMIAIREEIRAIEQGKMDRTDNPLKNAPHTAAAVSATEWAHPYRREQGAFPAPWVRDHKFWPPVGRIDNVWGDRNLFCTCPPMELSDL